MTDVPFVNNYPEPVHIKGNVSLCTHNAALRHVDYIITSLRDFIDKHLKKNNHCRATLFITVCQVSIVFFFFFDYVLRYILDLPVFLYHSP